VSTSFDFVTATHLGADLPAAQPTDEPFTDDELTELALAAGWSDEVAADAVPISRYLGEQASPLPAWYMPAAVVRGSTRLRTAVVIAIVVAFVLIDAWGLCSTYGQIVLA
jgi:hypothetical protein